MINPIGVYTSIEAYLTQQGVSPRASTSCPSGQPDASQILHFALAVKQSACCTNVNGSCVRVSIESLLEHMSRVEGWTKQHHQSALMAGGYAPDYVSWPQKPADP